MVSALFLAMQLVLPQEPRAAEPPLAPGVTYRAEVPTLRGVTGHDFGERITTPEEISRYLEALHTADPARTVLVRYGTSWENRPLWLFIIGSPTRIANLERVKADLRRLADPRLLSSAEAERLVTDAPVVTWLMHGVHGNELSASDAALAEAYHLLAARNDPDVDAILSESIVVIDPIQNPDGRARFIAANLLAAGVEPDADPLAAEHDEPWPGGRSNHYLFDMNRDWFAQSQPETRGRVRAMLEWYPHVVADLHEMSGESTYYFAPPANPINPHVTPEQRDALDLFGRANAARFDARGFAYFVRETYDAFYPGYGESWPVFHGAVGMTFEQASARGLRWRRSDDQVLTYRDGVVHHFTAAITTAATAARNRDRLVRGFLAFRRTAISEGERGETREYVILPGTDPSRARRLALLLVSQGIEVRRTTQASRVGDRPVPAGAFVVSTAQPAARLARNLLDAQTEPDSVFVREVERRRRLQLPEQAYDVTAWSLPLLFDVDVLTSPRAISAPSALLTTDTVAAQTVLPEARVAYVLPWGTATAAVVADALSSGIRVRHASLPFTLEGRSYVAGSAIVRVSENGTDLRARLGGLVALHGAEAVPVQTGYQDEGISIGSTSVTALKSPRVLLAWDAPTSPLSAGWARYVLEQRYRIPVTVVRVASLSRLDIDAFSVIVLPSGDYERTAGEDFPRRLREWVRDGGTLVTIAEASTWAVSVGVLETRVENVPRRPQADSLRASSSGRGADTGAASEMATEGSILRVAVDSSDWLASGQDGDIQVLVDAQRTFGPIASDRGRTVGTYAAADRLLASGLLWDDARLRIAQKAFLIHQTTGQGHVIAFAEDPNYRAFTESTILLFINAVLLGPAY